MFIVEFEQITIPFYFLDLRTDMDHGRSRSLVPIQYKSKKSTKKSYELAMIQNKKNKVLKIKNTNIHVQDDVVRCDWVNSDPVYIAYHDNEWGQPQYNSKSLFEMLCLEGQQAGLSWITVLKKRNHYKSLFHNFNPHMVSEMNQNDIDRVLCDPGIIRHRGKLEAIVQNSKCYIEMEINDMNFGKFVWSFVDNIPIINNWSSSQEVPTQTVASTALSIALKKHGFKFVGSTICYAFMQACGLVNDHVTNCICRSTY